MERVLIFLVTLFFFGCNSIEKPEKPNNLIPKDKMAHILYDVFILNAAKGTSKSILENNGIYPENYVFKKYKIDSLQFALSNAYYGFNPEDYESIMTRVEDSIIKSKDLFQAKIDKEFEEKLRKEDSIKTLSDTLKVKKIRKPNKTYKRKDN